MATALTCEDRPGASSGFALLYYYLLYSTSRVVFSLLILLYQSTSLRQPLMPYYCYPVSLI